MQAFGVLGTGMVGLAIGNRLAELGRDVMLGTRDPAASRGKLERKHDRVQLGTFAQAAEFGELNFNATNGAASLAALKLAGEANLNGKTLIDIANPLDFSKGMPPTLLVSDTDSLAEQIQRSFPKARVVKALNMVTAAVMAHPRSLENGDHDLFLCGNDTDAKAETTAILREFGWSRFLDLGDLSAARGMEMYLPLWLRTWGALGTGLFNVKLVRQAKETE